MGSFARVNSMLTGGKADPDLQKQIKVGGYKKKKKQRKNQLMNGLMTKTLFSLTKIDMVMSGQIT